MEGHRLLDDQVGSRSKTGDRIATGPGRRIADADGITAMMPSVVRQAGFVDDLLPGSIDLAGTAPRDQGGTDGLEGSNGMLSHRRIPIGNRAQVNEAAERCMVAADAA